MKTQGIFVCLCTWIVLQGCFKNKNSENTVAPSPSSQASLALVGDSPIHVADLKQYLEYKPVPTNPLQEDELKKRLDELLTSEVLYQEALAQKLDQDPVIKRKIQQILTQRLLKKQIHDPIYATEPSEEELRAYYQQHVSEFQRKPQIRVANIFISKTTDDAQQLAQQALKDVKTIEGKPAGFGPLIRKYSDTPKNFNKGDTGYFDEDGFPKSLESKLAQGAFQLQKVGEVHPQVLETSDGYHIIMLIGKRPALHRNFEQVQHEIRRRVIQQKLKSEQQSYVQKLKKQAHIQIQKDIFQNTFHELQKQFSEGSASQPPRATALSIPE